jgi:hypothetical protein
MARYRQRLAHPAFDFEEHRPGIPTVGTALLDLSGKAIAVSISTPSLRFANRKDEITTRLRQFRGLIKTSCEADGARGAAAPCGFTQAQSVGPLAPSARSKDGPVGQANLHCLCRAAARVRQIVAPASRRLGPFRSPT